ncbi:ExeM/NucH family extracellular endonuclease [uncultured Roseobacter sp.]|uniref:ExeM/NucH family extracellular endonuclease n=1 Tax=uncultured Roseobacter sp. TaxID=114847 RepID=UPI00260A6BCE|nr:ExeM/NucH family extracellular endonuclease [uncultured Roseobacter sp.]
MSAFINEFHYDNAGGDIGEFVEIAAPAGFDLTGWSLVLYNGSNGASYNTLDLSGLTVTDSGNGFGFVSVDAVGIQNGSPDGIALVDNTGGVVEFLSYEGNLVATDGPAAGLTSTDIGVSEPGNTNVGQSLQRTGDGQAGADFVFSAPLDATRDAVNEGQTFGPVVAAPPSLVINEIHADPAADISGDANGDGVRDATDDEFVEIVNQGDLEVDLSGITLSDAVGVRHTFADGTTLAAGAAVVVFGGGTPTGDFGGAQIFTASTGSLGLNNGGETVSLETADGETIQEVTYGSEGGNNQSLTRDPDISGDFAGHSDIAAANGAIFSPGTEVDGDPFETVLEPVLMLAINEIHADPAADLTGDANGDGTRSATDDEFIEIVNTGSEEADLSGVTLSDAVGLRHTFADGTILAVGAAIVVFGGGTPTGDFGGAQVVTASSGSLGLNNGGDTVTLANADGTLIQEVVYGSEGGNNQSVTRDPDLDGAFVQHTDASGAEGAIYSPGSQVNGDPFVAGPVMLTINEVDADQTGSDAAEFIELYDGGVGGTPLDGYTVVLFNGNDDTAYDAFDLDGFSTDENGFFVIGSENVANVDLEAFTTNGLQNGADAVGLYLGDPADISVATTDNLVDALVYDTNDADDAGLLAALGQTTQYNEGATNSTADALARNPDGSGEFVAQAPTPGETNEVIAPPELVKISEIQGSTAFNGFADFATVGIDDRSVLEGQTIRIQAIVTADFQSMMSNVEGADLNGFFVQEEDADADADASTSEGIFIFDDFAEGNPDVQVGDLVEVTGTVSEFFGETQISASAVEVIASNQLLPTATVVNLGSEGVMIDQDGDFVANLEAYEGMLVTLPQSLEVTELFQLGRFGTLKASADGRLEQFTQNNAPDAEGYAQHLQDIAARTITLDDGSREQNADLIRIPDGNDGILTASDSFRMGDTLTNVTGVLSYSEDFQSSSEEPEFRIHLPTADYEASNPRTETPEDVGGNFKVASLNVLNYFTTLDDGSNTAGPNDDQGGRGADDLTRFGVEPATAEFDRQVNKIVQAVVEIDADVLGLVELENDDDIAIADLVARVNAELGSEVYDFIPTGDFGGDAITVGMIYKTGSVAPLGESAGLFEFEGRNFLDPLDAGRELNRPALAQTFQDLSSGETITVAVNHLKSKGSLSGLEADNDQLDGQGNNNATRTEAAKILADWLAADPTGQGAENTLIVGDLNAYAQEDPITALEDAGYTDLADTFIDGATSFVFDGQAGTLDYALANDALLSKVTGVTEWRINSDEATITDYNLDFGRDPTLYNGDTAARNSDHDPVIVGFNFKSEVFGTAKNDKLVGTEFDDFIDGLAGRDKYTGGDGADTFILGDRDRDKILDFSKVEGDRIDVSQWGVQGFEELEIYGQGRTAILADTISGNIAKVRFDDRDTRGSDLTEEDFVFAPVTDLVLVGGKSFDRLSGRQGDDLIDGGRGFNVLSGGGGEDVFVFNDKSTNLVTDFDVGMDKIDVSGLGINTFEDMAIRDVFSNALVRADKGSMYLTGVNSAELTEDDFIFSDTVFV